MGECCLSCVDLLEIRTLSPRTPLPTKLTICNTIFHTYPSGQSVRRGTVASTQISEKKWKRAASKHSSRQKPADSGSNGLANIPKVTMIKCWLVTRNLNRCSIKYWWAGFVEVGPVTPLSLSLLPICWPDDMRPWDGNLLQEWSVIAYIGNLTTQKKKPSCCCWRVALGMVCCSSESGAPKATKAKRQTCVSVAHLLHVYSAGFLNGAKSWYRTREIQTERKELNFVVRKFESLTKRSVGCCRWIV